MKVVALRLTGGTSPSDAWIRPYWRQMRKPSVKGADDIVTVGVVLLVVVSELESGFDAQGRVSGTCVIDVVQWYMSRLGPKPDSTGAMVKPASRGIL